MKIEKIIKKENERRVNRFMKSKLWIVLIVALLFASCKGNHFTTQFAIKTTETTYYCNHVQIDEPGRLISGAELKRDGVTIRQVFEIPFDSVVWVTYNNHKYEWR